MLTTAEGARGAQEALVAFEALLSCSAHNWGDGAPLRGHHFCQLQQFLVFLSRPFCLFYAGVQPLEPAGLALLGRLACQQGGDACPLVEAIFHHRCLEDFILHDKTL